MMKIRKKRPMKKTTMYFLCFAGIAIIGYLLFYAYPVFRTIYLSFTDKRVANPEVNWVGFDNFINIFKYEKLFPKAISNSFIYAFFSAAISLSLGLITALLLNSKIKGVGTFRVILFLPFVIPAFASTEIFKGLFDPNSGIINLMLHEIGIQGPGWFKSEETALLTMIIMSVWGFGSRMLIFLAALQNVPQELIEAAEIDGASRWRRFVSITLPMISPMFFLNVVLATIDGLKSFASGYMVGGVEGSPNYSTLLIPVLIYRIAFNTQYGGRRIGYASAMAWIFFAIIMAVTILQFILKRFYVYDDNE